MKIDFKELTTNGECFGITLNPKNIGNIELQFIAHYGLLEKNSFYWVKTYWLENYQQKTFHVLELTEKITDYPPISEDDFDRFYSETNTHTVILSKMDIGHFDESETVHFRNLVDKSTADYSYDAFVSSVRKEFN